MWRRRQQLGQSGRDQDLTPMIDVIFLLIIFFILAGRVTSDIRNEQIVVPPTKTAEPWVSTDSSQLVKLEVRRLGNVTRDHEMVMGLEQPWAVGEQDVTGYQHLCSALDRLYRKADFYAKGDQHIPKVMLEVRADADVDYRVIQAIQ